MKSTCGDWKKLENYTLLGNRAVLELEIEKSSVLTSLSDGVADGVARFTGRAFFLTAGNECKNYIKAIPTGATVRLIGVDLRPMLNVSISNVMKMEPNPAFPGFPILDDESVYEEHPTILIDNPEYHIVWVEQ